LNEKTLTELTGRVPLFISRNGKNQGGTSQQK
jgi:hypothetical protein